MMKLIGSTTSPYVRKVRLLLEGHEYQFVTLKALSPEGSKQLDSYGPVKRIPILIEDEKTIFDSSLICEYLLAKKSISLSIEEKLDLKLIDELCDSCISLFQQILWKTDPDWKNEQSSRMLKRANSILDHLDNIQSTNRLTLFQKDWLVCVLDWLSFRDVIAWKDNHDNLVSLYTESVDQKRFTNTKLTI